MKTETKTIEIRDRGTFVPALATRVECENGQSQDCYLLGRAGHRRTFIVLTHLQTGHSHWDPGCWDQTRTMRQAHRLLLEIWHKLDSGDVLDVEYLLGETPRPKLSERCTVQGVCE